MSSLEIVPGVVIHQGPKHFLTGAVGTPSEGVTVIVNIGRSGHIHIEVQGEGQKKKVASFEVLMDAVRPKSRHRE